MVSNFFGDVAAPFKGVANALDNRGNTAGIRDRAIANDPAAAAAQAKANPPATPPPATPPPTAAMAGTPQSASGQELTPQQITDIANGHIVPLLSALLQDAAAAYKAGPPKASDYPGSEVPNSPEESAFLQAQADWSNPKTGALPSLISLATQLENARKVGNSQITLQDGTLITQEMLHSNDPYVAAQAKTAYDNQARKLLTDWNTTANQAGMDQYKVGHDATVLANDTKTAKFNADLGSWNAGLDYDKTAISRAADDINRQLSGLAESRNRADLTTKSLQAAAPYATANGKTDFSGTDFGSGIADIIRQGGGDPSGSFLKFPTSIHIDPTALMQQGDQSLGVTGALPLVPQMTTSRTDIPTSPIYQQGPSVPLIQTPPPPVISPPVDSIPLVPQGATAYDPAVEQQIRAREQMMGLF